MVLQLKPFKYYLMTSSVSRRIGWISDICGICHWIHNSVLINFYYRTLPFKSQIWELQTFKSDALKLLLLFELGVFCLPVGIEEHLREKYLQLKIKIQQEWVVSEAALVLQDIMFFKTDGIVKVFMSFSNFNFYDLILKFI